MICTVLRTRSNGPVNNMRSSDSIPQNDMTTLTTTRGEEGKVQPLIAIERISSTSQMSAFLIFLFP